MVLLVDDVVDAVPVDQQVLLEVDIFVKITLNMNITIIYVLVLFSIC